MEKLRLNDIQLLGDGPQIRRYIEKNHGKLEEFYAGKDMSLSLKTVKTYLSQQVITSDTLKHALVRILNKNYYELVLTKGEQLKVYVWNVFDNIRLYKDEEDYNTFERLVELCKEYSLDLEKSMMYRAIAMNFYYSNWIYKAIEWYEKSMQELEVYDIDKYVLMLVELADICYRENILERAEKEYQKAETYIGKSKLSNNTLFKYYYWRGIMLNNTGMHSKARKYFDNAYEFVESEEEKSATILNIALTYKKEYKYDDAVTQYNKMLELYNDDNIVGKGSVYNNIAMTYYEKGQLKEALINATKSMFLINFTNDLFYKLSSTHTFALISIANGDISTCEDYMELLRETIYRQVNKKSIINDIDSLVNLLSDVVMLEKFELSVSELIENTSNIKYKNDLKCCLGNIHNKVIIIKHGRYNNEKDYKRLI